ncbi:MAG: hypothetical protein AAGA48_30410 [Myxococcota bacterium]
MASSDPTNRSASRTARFEEMRPMGRKLLGPIADFIDLSHATGHHVAVAFADPRPIHEAFGHALAPVRDFLEWPLVDGIAPLAAVRPGLLVYRTGRPVRSVHELAAVFAEDGGMGPRAVLQWLASTARTMIDVGIAGHDRGLLNHGGLDAWFATVDETGHPVVLGYGIPPFDVEAYLSGGTELPAPTRLRYVPPERLEGHPEGVESDLFALCLMAVELATGLPVYRGSASAVWALAQRGDVRTSLQEVPEVVATVVSAMLRTDGRVPDPERWWAAVDRASRQAQGRSLAEAVQYAAEFITDAEEDLPSAFRIADLLPNDPERRAAEERAQRAVDEAHETVTLLVTALDQRQSELDRTLPRISEIVNDADVAMAAAEESSRQVQQALLRAGSAPNGETANQAADEAEAALVKVKEYAETAHQKLAHAVEQMASARVERVQERAGEAAKRWAQLEALAAEASWLPRLADEAQQRLTQARLSYRSTQLLPEGAPPTDEEQLAAMGELQSQIEEMETLADQARSVRQAEGHVRTIEELQRKHPEHAEKLARHAQAAREAAIEGRSAPNLNVAKAAAERARQEATAAQAVGSFLQAIQVDANEAVSQIIAAHAQVTEAYEAMPHDEIAAVQGLVGRALATVQEDQTQAATQLVVATEAAERAIELRQQLTRRVTRARQQASDQLEQVTMAAATVVAASLAGPLEQLRNQVEATQAAQLPEPAEAAAAEVASLARELMRQVGGVQAELQELRNRARQTIARLPNSIDVERFDALRAQADQLEEVLDPAVLQGEVEQIRNTVDGWLVELAQAQAQLQDAKERGRKALATAEAEHLAAPAEMVVEREGEATEPVDLGAMVEQVQALVAQLEATADPTAAQDLAQRAEDVADQVASIAGAGREAMVQRISEAQAAAGALVSRILAEQSEAHAVELQAAFTRALDLANRAEQGDDLNAIQRDLAAARAAFEQAHQHRQAEVAHLHSLHERAKSAIVAANALLESASQPGVRHHVEAVHTAVEQVRTTNDPELAAQAVEAAEMSMQAARQVANEAMSAARARARAAVDHAHRVLERHDEGEVRLYAEAARVAGEIAATAESCNEVVQAADRAEVAAKAVEIARAQAAVERASAALARSDGPDVRLAIEEARQAVGDAEDADSLAAATRAADAATMAAEAAHKAAGRLAEVHDQLRARAQEALRAAQRAATETQVAVVRELASQGEAAMAVLQSADSLDAAEVALQQIEAAALQAQQHATVFADQREAEIVRATAAVSRIERARTAAEESEHVVRIADAADLRLAEARATRDAAELNALVNGIEALAEQADGALSEYLGAVADTAQQAIATLARAEALLDETSDEEVRQIVARARTAARRAEEDETLPAMQQAAALAQQALDAVQQKVQSEQATARQAVQEQGLAILLRIETAGEGFDDPRFAEHVQAIRDALDRIGAAVDTQTAQAEVAAAAASAEAAQSVVDSRLEVLRHRAREAANRASQIDGPGAPAAVRQWIESASKASEEVGRAINVAAAEESADQAEYAANSAVKLATEHRQALEEIQERAVTARNRAEELIGRAPPDGMRAVEAARVAADEALSATEVPVAMAAAQRAETSANEALSITDASRGVVEAHRARVAAAMRRIEQASWEADEVVVKDSLTIVKNLTETVKASADPAVTEPAAKAAEEAAERAEAAIADRRQRVAAVRQRADDARGRAEGLLGLSGAEEVKQGVEIARAAADRAAAAEDLETAKEALIEAEQAIAQAQRVAHAEVEQRTTARRRAQRALGGVQTLLDEIDTEAMHKALATAKEAVAQASNASVVEVAARAAEAAEAALADAEQEAQAYRAQLKAERALAREANEAARAVLLRARGSTVEKAVDAARRAFDAAMAATSVDQAQAAAARASEAAQLASTLADQAQQACAEAREQAHAAVSSARECLRELSSEQVQRKVDDAIAAAERADKAIAPEVARQAAEAAEVAAKGAREEVEIRHVQLQAGQAKERVASLLVPDLPQEAPPELKQQHQALRQALVGVDQAVVAVQGARGLEATKARAEVAQKAASDVLARFEALQEAIRVWQAQRRRQAATDVRPAEDLLQKVRAETAEVRRIAPKSAYGVLSEADLADSDAATAVELAQRAAEAGDPDGVTQGLEGLRKALTRAQQAMKTAQMALQIEAQRKAAKVRQALRSALDEAEAMRLDAQSLLERVVDEDAKWHASRAAEAAAAARDAAQRAGAAEPSDASIDLVERGLRRAQAALETAFNEAPSGARTQQRSARPGERNRALEQLEAVREVKKPKPAPEPTFKAEPINPDTAPLPNYRRPVPDDPGPASTFDAHDPFAPDAEPAPEPEPEPAPEPGPAPAPASVAGPDREPEPPPYAEDAVTEMPGATLDVEHPAPFEADELSEDDIDLSETEGLLDEAELAETIAMDREAMRRRAESDEADV